MTYLDCPACDHPVPVELPQLDAIRCDDCAVTWTVTDPVPEAVALAA